MEDYRFAGCRIVGFPSESRAALSEVAHRLVPHRREVVGRWVEQQFRTWEPPGIERAQIAHLFGSLWGHMLEAMAAGEPEACLSRLEDAGAVLARRKFPFEALMLSIHFLEESYLPYLLDPRPANLHTWLIRMDEFLHVAIGALATSYFEFHRRELTASAEIGWVIQEGLSPHIPKRFGDLEIGHAYVSATERALLGGDFMELFPISPRKAAFLVGDLSGHGLEAVADAVMIRALFRGLIRETPDLPDVMARLSRILAHELDGEHFATVLAGTCDASGHLELVNAGGPPPVVANGSCSLMEQRGLPLAVDENPQYTRATLDLGRGGLFVAYTDGLVEARRDSDFFGEQRLQDLVVAMRDTPARAVAEHLLDRALAHARGHAADDISIVVLKRLEGAV
ncbi:MAG: serine/threonine-protein phosphatase [Armatimonadetes bacterium]|nr:serine/threonine-protein phosphatase [Armatimonadota bacterium]